jgi:hypothetical protein
MKKFMLICTVFLSLNLSAQLPSEKPMDEMISPAAKSKLQTTKQRNFSPAELPSNRPLPKDVPSVRKKASSPHLTEKAVQAILPSNSADDWKVPHTPKRKRNK